MREEDKPKPVEINSDTVKQLRAHPYISAEAARNIVRYRDGYAGKNKRRYFRGPEDLARVAGISRRNAEQLASHINWRVPPHRRRIINFRPFKWGRKLKRAVLAMMSVLATLAVLNQTVGFPTPADVSRQAFPGDNIRIDYAEISQTSIIENFDPNRSLRYYLDNDLVAHTSPHIHIDVVSRVDDEEIKLAPYLLVEIIDVKPLAQPVDHLTAAAGMGGGHVRYFAATLSPERNEMFGAPQQQAIRTNAAYRSSQQEPFPHYTLAPGELETFLLAIDMVPGYHYRYRVGVLYSHGGTEGVKYEWIDDEFLAASPAEIGEVWIIKGLNDVEPARQELREKVQNEHPEQPAAHSVEREEEAIQEYEGFFELPQDGT